VFNVTRRDIHVFEELYHTAFGFYIGPYWLLSSIYSTHLEFLKEQGTVGGAWEGVSPPHPTTNLWKYRKAGNGFTAF